MAEILNFRPRRPAPSIARSDVLDGPALRAEIEQAAQAALDQADRLIALLDHMEGEPAAPAQAAEIAAPQVVWLHGRDHSPEVAPVEPCS